MDWDNARVFLAIYRMGTLRGASSALHVDQATVGRRLASLEKSLDVRLFLRTPAGYVPTPAGELAFHAAERMENAAHQLQRQMQGTDKQLSGTVRVACTDGTAVYAMMNALQTLHASHPDIRVVLTTSSQMTNLTRREADLAVRPVRPDSPDLITRHLARCEAALYASQSYLEARGEPRQGVALAGHDVVIYQPSIARYQSETLCEEPICNAKVALEVNTSLMLFHAVRAGLGIGELPTFLAHDDPLLQRIWPDRAVPYDMWLVLHGDLNRTARVRAVADAIIEVFEKLSKAASIREKDSPRLEPAVNMASMNPRMHGK
ncbi:LysR family transcriptional regulator [Paralcaligenes sp. KSB-10]|uniref:LysR family transcriptional regulator n=1 Tax=Paralcaligenes sp. KSB-10 TaxID=2901142 RepID=UPI001E56710B|nr:LysR family transcriptional regulator [Paralcaligenes sp. KSB-10]UHL64748.1 LysR family transcriptional regulator [Paralcaligenes sp. KSB-10]